MVIIIIISLVLLSFLIPVGINLMKFWFDVKKRYKRYKYIDLYNTTQQPIYIKEERTNGFMSDSYTHVFTITNIQEKTIKAIEIKKIKRNIFNNEINTSVEIIHKKIKQYKEKQFHETYYKTHVTKIEVQVLRVLFEDDTTWKYNKN